MNRSPKSRMPMMLCGAGVLLVGMALVGWLIAGCASSVTHLSSDKASRYRAQSMREQTSTIQGNNVQGNNANSAGTRSPLVPPQSLPAPNEELWIIQKPTAGQAAQPARDDLPG